jgi:hypothetical protein
MPGEHGCRHPDGGIRYTASTYTGCSPVCGRWPGSTGKEDAVCTTERRERDTRYIALCSRVASGPVSGSDNARGVPPLAFSNPSRRDRTVGGCGRQSPSPSLQLLFHAHRPTIDCWCGVASANNSRAQAPHRRPHRGFTISGHCGGDCGMSFPLVVIIGIDLSRLMTFVEDDRPREDDMGQREGKVITEPAGGYHRPAHNTARSSCCRPLARRVIDSDKSHDNRYDIARVTHCSARRFPFGARDVSNRMPGRCLQRRREG